MKVRKLAVALALAGGLGSNLAYALGLGDAEIKSNLNEPLKAEIGLVGTKGLSRDEIIASLAPERDFRKVGVEPIFFLSEIQFDVVKNNRGELVLQLTTNKPVREPYLNFLVEVAWPSGRLLREYALLIDPPLFRDGNPESKPQVATTSRPVAEQPKARSQQRPTQQRSVQSVSQAPSGPTERVVSSTDTLWNIARELRPAGDLTPQQVMLALQDANPDAFLRSNINLVREGSVLRIPSEEAMRSRSRREAVQQVMAQNRTFEQGSQSAQEVAIDGAGERRGSTGRASKPVESGDELRLLAGAGSGTNDGSHGGEMGGSGAGNAESRLSTTLEELDRSKRENEELNSRVGDLQEQLANMQRLIELKNDRLAALQAEKAADAAQDSSASGPGGSAGLSAENQAIAPGAADGSQRAGGTQGSNPTGEADPKGGEGDSLAAAANSQSVPAVNESVPSQSENAAPSVSAEMQSESAADLSVAGLIKMIKESPLYQAVAGAIAITLLGLLWLMARRGGKREEEFYAQLEREESDFDISGAPANGDSFAAGLAAAGVTDIADDSSEQHRDASRQLAGADTDGDKDVVAEAEAYMAYGRLDKAAEVLEKAISQEPDRTDLRLKALEVYADDNDEEGFARHMASVAVADDAMALTKAEALRERLAAGSGGLSIDDLELQLRGDVGQGDVVSKSDAIEDDDLGIDWSLDEPVEGTEETGGEASRPSDLDFDSELAQFNTELESEKELPQSEGEDQGIDFNFDDSELDDALEEQDRKSADADDLTTERPTGNDVPFDFSFDEAELGAAGDEDKGADMTDEDLDKLDLGDALEDDLQALETAQVEEAKAEHEIKSPEPLDEDELPAAFDDSFLDELDAELDKVDEEEASEGLSAAPEAADSTVADLDDVLGDLELDVSDEDLALFEEVAGGDPLPDIDAEISDDSIEKAPAGASADSWRMARERDGGGTIPHLDPAAGGSEVGEFDDSFLDLDDNEKSSTGFSEGDLGDEDDFDFLEGTDEAGTKLDLARAYVEMGDSDGARDILGEVALEGSDAQKREAETLLKELS